MGLLYNRRTTCSRPIICPILLNLDGFGGIWSMCVLRVMRQSLMPLAVLTKDAGVQNVAHIVNYTTSQVTSNAVILNCITHALGVFRCVYFGNFSN